MPRIFALAVGGIVGAVPGGARDGLTSAASVALAAAARRIGIENPAITLVVSHRFSTAGAADLIAVLDDGQLLELGTHDELMARRGRYAELFDLQARAYA